MKRIRSPKFDSYKSTFIFMFSLFLTGTVIALVLRHKNILQPLYPIYEKYKYYLEISLEKGYVYSLIDLAFPLLLFIFGVTVYSPACAILTMLSYSVYLTSKITAASRESFKFAFIELFFGTVFGYILIIYSSLMFLLSVKIFTPKKGDKLFTGILFSAEGIKSIFNYRFLATYILFFILVLIFSAIMIFVKCVLQSII